jgi:peroxiredoxin
MSRLPTLATCFLTVSSAIAVLPAAESTPSLLDERGNPAGFRTLDIGDTAPDFALPGIDGKTHRLSDFAGPDVLMILFTSNHCPTSHGMEQRLLSLRNAYHTRSFTMVAINPNHPDGLSADELGYGEYGDSFAEMKPYAEKNGWDFPYLYDGDTQLVARAYGCLATPHVFIFDRQRKLRYAGAFDDSRYPQEETVRNHYARDAIEALLAGRPIATELTKPFGCSTKWREKRAAHVALETSWTKIPVTLEKIDADGVKALRDNPTNKYRFFNVWATWCAPCVEEFPMLVAISRKFDMRDFELITVSMDDPKHEARAHAFLEQQGAGLTRRKEASVKRERRKTNHYLYTGASQDALVSALDSEWPGPIPHTVLVAPGGKVVWRHNGKIDSAAAIAAIVEAMTPYYQPPPPKTE